LKADLDTGMLEEKQEARARHGYFELLGKHPSIFCITDFEMKIWGHARKDVRFARYAGITVSLQIWL
jgi:hypothetical protein